jgi:hypothetical protein
MAFPHSSDLLLLQRYVLHSLLTAAVSPAHNYLCVGLLIADLIVHVYHLQLLSVHRFVFVFRSLRCPCRHQLRLLYQLNILPLFFEQLMRNPMLLSVRVTSTTPLIHCLPLALDPQPAI